MNKYVNIKCNEPPKQTQEILIETEQKFKLLLLKSLGKSYKIMKSKDNFNPLDFCIINKQNLKIVYLEHKKRNGEKNNYQSVIINYCKLSQMEKHYKNSIMVFEYDKLDYLMYIKYDKSFLKYDTTKIKNQDVIFLKNEDCCLGYENLIREIISCLK
jgi:hypothetical protein